jgi:hypothetical protein
MTEEITTVKYLIDELVDVRVACQFWIDKDHDTQARIKELEEHNTLLKERFEKDESSYLDATKAAFKRYIDAEGIRPNERFSKVVKQLQMYLPIDPKVFHTNDVTDVSTTPEMVSKDVAVTYQKELVKAEKRIKELEERVGRIDELTNEVYGEGPDYPARFTLNNVVYFEDERGCFMIANDGATDFTVTITHQEYVDSLNQYLKQEDPRDYPEEPSE